MRFRLFSAVATAVLVTAVLTGCIGSPDPVKTTPGFSSEEEAFAAAEQTYRNYVDALNQVDLSDPATFEPVYKWTTGELNAADRKQFTQMHGDRWRVSGDSKVVLIDPRSLGGDPAQVDLNVCVDVGDVSLTDEQGSSKVAPDRRDVQTTLVTAVSRVGSETGWLLSDIVGREGEPVCPQ